ncbi:MFS transporter [Nonomuraea cavernae]|uniref:MFS transporter n=1 Tax=Nonomuraea cavernae TaxID=2045107 RepID=A0A917YW77_9ACTN|nr:MFS transporter [Nonomuraea cavernae]MCA2185329.1 MFS transporter [Nonomuraea cavernae]GGO66131.1 MFS transporter [Nonomuraea cavernae]
MSSPPERSPAAAPAPATDAAPRAADAKLTGFGVMTLAVIVSCELILMLDATIMNVALPEIRGGLGFTPVGLSWVTNAFLLAYGGLMLLGGRAGDILGHRKVFLIGMALFTAASLLGGLAPTPEVLIVARAVQGLGAALAAPSTLALLTTNFQGSLQAKALGVYSSVTASAMTFGLVLGGVITTALSWRWVLFINVPIGLFAILVAPRYVAKSPTRAGRFDVSGALTSVFGLVGVALALARTVEHGWQDPVALAALTTGVVLLVAFVLIESRARQPIMPLRLFADRTRAAAFAGLLLIPMVTVSMQFFVVQFLQEVLHHSPLQAGLAFLPMAIGMLLTAQNASKAIAKFSAKTVALVGVALLVAGVAWLVPISAMTSYVAGIAGPLLLAGVGLGLVVVPFNMAIMSTVDPAESGVAAGVLQTAMLIGASVGLAALSTVYASTIEENSASVTRPTVDAIAAGMGAAFAVSLGFAATALLIIFFVMKRTRLP